MGKLGMMFLLAASFLLNANIYDFDPHNDNPHGTYLLLAAAIPALPQQHAPDAGTFTCGGYNRGDPADPHPCACARTEDPPDGTACPMHEPGPRPEDEGSKCKNYCFGDHCHCTNSCDD